MSGSFFIRMGSVTCQTNPNYLYFCHFENFVYAKTRG